MKDEYGDLFERPTLHIVGSSDFVNIGEELVANDEYNGVLDSNEHSSKLCTCTDLPCSCHGNDGVLDSTDEDAIPVVYLQRDHSCSIVGAEPIVCVCGCEEMPCECKCCRCSEITENYDTILHSTEVEEGFDFSMMCSCDTLSPPYCKACMQRTEQKEMLIAKYPQLLHSNEARMLVSYLLDMYLIEIHPLDRALEEMSKSKEWPPFSEAITDIMGGA